MMKCSRCGNEHEDGAVVYSPVFLAEQTIRYTICQKCWVPLTHFVNGYAVHVKDAEPLAPKIKEPHEALWRTEWEHISEIARVLQNKISDLKSCLPDLNTMISMCKPGSDFHDILTIFKEKIER